MEFAPAPFPADLEAGYRARRGSTPTSWSRNCCSATSSSSAAPTAVIDDTHEVSWAELADAAARVASVLAAHDIGPGAVVVWQLPELVGGDRRRPRDLDGRGDLGAGRAHLPRARAGRDHAGGATRLRDRTAVVPRSRSRRDARGGGAGSRGDAGSADRRARRRDRLGVVGRHAARRGPQPRARSTRTRRRSSASPRAPRRVPRVPS